MIIQDIDTIGTSTFEFLQKKYDVSMQKRRHD